MSELVVFVLLLYDFTLLGALVKEESSLGSLLSVSVDNQVNGSLDQVLSLAHTVVDGSFPEVTSQV